MGGTALQLKIDDLGGGRPVLVLHGGGGPATVAGPPPPCSTSTGRPPPKSSIFSCSAVPPIVPLLYQYVDIHILISLSFNVNHMKCIGMHRQPNIAGTTLPR